MIFDFRLSIFPGARPRTSWARADVRGRAAQCIAATCALALLAFSPTIAKSARAADVPCVIVVVGAEGEPEFGEAFNKSADQWAEAAHRAGADFLLIGRDPIPSKLEPGTVLVTAPTETAPATAQGTMPATAPATVPVAASAPAPDPNYKTDRQRLQEKLAAQVAETKQPLWLVFIGHGTADRNEAKFNLRDTDVSNTDLVTWLKPMKRPLAVIDCSASSAPFLQSLSATNRVIITATRSASEINYSRLGEYLAASIADPSADLDKDGQTSLLEAFVAAAHRTKEFYDTEGRLMTEHALIDDNGDGQGTPAEAFQGIRVTQQLRGAGGGRGGAARGAPAKPDGAYAHTWTLLPSKEELAMSDDAKRERAALEQRVETLRTRKASMSADDYYSQLDALFMQLADIYKPAQK